MFANWKTPFMHLIPWTHQSSIHYCQRSCYRSRGLLNERESTRLRSRRNGLKGQMKLMPWDHCQCYCISFDVCNSIAFKIYISEWPLKFFWTDSQLLGKLPAFLVPTFLDDWILLSQYLLKVIEHPSIRQLTSYHPSEWRRFQWRRRIPRLWKSLTNGYTMVTSRLSICRRCSKCSRNAPFILDGIIAAENAG